MTQMVGIDRKFDNSDNLDDFLTIFLKFFLPIIFSDDFSEVSYDVSDAFL